MQLLHIYSDFDENELRTKTHKTIESFVEDSIGIGYTLEQLKELAEDEDENPDEKFCLNLILSGIHEGEWSTEEVWIIKDGQFRQGLA